MAGEIEIDITDLQEDYMLKYMRSVLKERAVPDVRDGLKPVHRYCVWDEYDTGCFPNKPHVKCATTIGNIIGKYHPHGDSAAYDALTRLAQPFNNNLTLIDGHGNFGNINGDSSAAYRYCLTKDSILTLSDGRMIYINDIVKNSENNSTTDIDLNCIDLNGKEVHASKFFNSGKHPIYKLTTEFKSEISGTSNHPLMVLAYENNKILIKWKTLSEINTGDILLKPKMNIYKQIPISNKEKQLAIFYGGFVSEGGFSKNQSYYRITFSNSDTEYYDLVLNGYKTYLNENNFENINIRENPNATYTNKKVTEFCTENKALYNLLKNEIGGNATEKCIPKFIMNSNMEIQKWFLKALFEGDGGIAIINDKRRNEKYGRIFYASYSKKLIKEVRVMLNNFNIFSTVNKDRNGFQISIRAFNDIKRFYNIIGFLSDRKNNILKNYIKYKEDYMKTHSKQTERRIPLISNYLKDNGSKRPSINKFMQYFRTSTFSDFVANKEKLKNYLTDDKYSELVNIVNILNNYNFEKVSSIEKLNEEDIVYSIHVDSDDHSFIADGFINHNTESRLTKYGLELCEDINKNAVDFVDNYTRTLTEPTVLPAKVCNLLVNGTIGIAVGFAPNIPPHNINDVCDMTIKLINEPDTSLDYIASHLKPDYPTGGIICNSSDLSKAYKTGKGTVKIRSNVEIINNKNGTSIIRVLDIPYSNTIGPKIKIGSTNSDGGLINSIVDKIKDGTIEGISDIQDHSKKDIDIKIFIKKDYDPNIILQQLYKYTKLEDTLKIQLFCLNNKKFSIYNIKRIFEEFIEFRRDTIRRIVIFDINSLKKRIHLIEGQIIALSAIDDVVKIIRSSKDKDIAAVNLKKRLPQLTTVQINNILDMRLSALTSLEVNKLVNEKKEKETEVAKLMNELSIKSINQRIINEQLEFKKKYGYPRRTTCSDINTNITEEDIIEKEDCVLVLTKTGFVKRLPSDKFKTQKRNTQGNNISDDVREIFSTNTKDHLLCFTNTGRVFDIKVYKITECSIKSKGTLLSLNLKPKEKVIKFLCLSDEQISDKKSYLMFITKNGLGKKTSLDEYKSINNSGLIAIDLKDNDKIVFVGYINPKEKIQDIIIASANGMTVRYDHEEFKPIGRVAQGNAVMKLGEGDYIASACIINSLKDKIFFITKNGLGKTTLITDMVKKKDPNTKQIVDINDGFPRLKRSATIKGRIGIALKDDRLVEIIPIHEKDDIKDIIITTTSKVLTISTEDFLDPLKRTTYGKKLISIKDNNDSILSVTLR